MAGAAERVETTDTVRAFLQRKYREMDLPNPHEGETLAYGGAPAYRPEFPDASPIKQSPTTASAVSALPPQLQVVPNDDASPRDTVTIQPGPGTWDVLTVWDDEGKVALMVSLDPLYLSDDLVGRMLALVRGVRATRFALPRYVNGPRLVRSSPPPTTSLGAVLLLLGGWISGLSFLAVA